MTSVSAVSAITITPPCGTDTGARDSLTATDSQGRETKKADKGSLTPDEWAEIEKLAARDREVRAHEMAHLAAAGPYSRGGPNYSYQTGPDGKRYAIGGEVQIDTSPDPHSPEATLIKARTIQAAANAPASPSGQDHAVAAAAAQMAVEARQQIAERDAEKNKEALEPKKLLGSTEQKMGRYIDVHA